MPFGRRDRLDREPAVLDQHHLSETGIGLDLLQRDRLDERSNRPDVDGEPLAGRVRRIGMRLGDRQDFVFVIGGCVAMAQKTGMFI